MRGAESCARHLLVSCLITPLSMFTTICAARFLIKFQQTNKKRESWVCTHWRAVNFKQALRLLREVIKATKNAQCFCLKMMQNILKSIICTILFSTTIKSKIYVYLCIIKIIKYVGNWFENVLYLEWIQ